MTIAQLTVAYEIDDGIYYHPHGWHKECFKFLTNDKYPRDYPGDPDRLAIYGPADEPPFNSEIKSLQPVLDKANELLAYTKANLYTVKIALWSQAVPPQSAIAMMQDKGMTQDDIALSLLDDAFSKLL